MRGSIIFASGVALGLAAFGGDTNLDGQNAISAAPPGFQASTVTHETRTESETPTGAVSVTEIPVQSDIGPQQEAPSTRSSFMASWNRSNGVNGYLLDVSTTSSFSNYVAGYHDLDVGNVAGRAVTGLNPGTTYYYRVRPYTATGPTSYSKAITATTAPATGLIIHATFDSSITNNANAAVIEAMINRAISIYESLFNDPITIEVLFRYATTAPNGHQLPQGTVSRTDSVIYIIPWSVFINALRADATTNNDSLANVSLPSTSLAANIQPSGPNGRAVGLDTPPAMFANGTVGNGGPYDGIITLNSSTPLQFTRPVNTSSFDAQRATEHEMDELIGLGSKLGQNGIDFRPQDLFSWSSAGHRNTTSSGTRYFSIDGGNTNIVNFNQDSHGDFGDWLSDQCPQEHPYVQNAFGCTGQSADISATSPEGINLDVIGYDLSRVALSNISTRGFVQTGNNVMIGGFIVGGSGPKTVIIRAIGPELSVPPFNIPNTLANPTLELHNGSGTLIASNDNWQTTIIGGIITSNQVSAIQNSGHAPTQPTESAIIATLQPGSYTAIVRGVNNTTGVALVEVYDISPEATSILNNISTRGFVQTGNNVMIGGFIIGGSGSKTVIIRAIGPELSAPPFNIPNALANPTLELHNGSGTLIASNDNWQTTIIGGIITSSEVGAIQNSGHVPTQPSESAIIATLPAGNYTAIVRGANNTTGVALVEVYDLQ